MISSPQSGKILRGKEGGGRRDDINFLLGYIHLVRLPGSAFTVCVVMVGCGGQTNKFVTTNSI